MRRLPPDPRCLPVGARLARVERTLLLRYSLNGLYAAFFTPDLTLPTQARTLLERFRLDR